MSIATVRSGSRDSKRISTQNELRHLPDNIVPTHYNLELTPNLQTFTFTGKTTILINIREPTRTITLNALDLNIHGAELSLTCTDVLVLRPTSITYLPEDETAMLDFSELLPAVGNNAKLTMSFAGVLNDNLKGFYRSKYFTLSGEERYAAVTQFEVADARRCFPCWDEPAIKATFDIKLVVPSDRLALSNMPVSKEEFSAEGLRNVHFDRTPVMSTYLVAVVVGEFDYVAAKSEDGVIVRVFTPLGKRDQGQFALEVAIRSLPFYKSFFNIAYPLPKLDLIAISDFWADAMENWGLITYRETSVLVDPINSSLIRKQFIALTIAHVIAHQWFGNLVTTEWWNHLWLYEAYAAFVKYLCVHQLFPQCDIATQLVTDMYTRALNSDDRMNTHPIEVPVDHPDEVLELIDEISYNKGVSVIRMLHDYIGEANSRKGMHIYLKRHQYKNTRTDELWTALQEASGKPVSDIMFAWTNQKGFPLVLVDSVQQTEDNKRMLRLTQHKFNTDSVQPVEYTWIIPVRVSTARDPLKNGQTFCLDKQFMEIVLDDVSAEDWVKVNAGTVGYYRTRYSKEMFEKLVRAVRNMELPPLDRLGLIDDMFALVMVGQANSVEVLELIESCRNETNYAVWTTITNNLFIWHILISSQPHLVKHFNAYGRKLYGPVADRLGWEERDGEHHLNRLLRSLVLSSLVAFRCEKTIAESQRRFRDHVDNVRVLHADFRFACYMAALQGGNRDVFQQMLALYRSTDLHEEKERIARAMGCMEDVELLRQLINFAISGEVRKQDAVYVIVAVAVNPRGRDLAWQFFKDNNKKLLDQFQGSSLLVHLIKNLIENFESEKRAIEVEEFFASNTFPGTEHTVALAVEKIRINARWLERDMNALATFLKTK